MRARWLGTVLLLASLVVACGSEIAPTPTAVEWYSLGAAISLSPLSSYRARYAFRWQGTGSGPQKTTSWDVLEESVREPPARHVLWSEEVTDGSSTVSEMEYIQLGNDSYTRVGTEWTPMTGSGMDIFGGNAFLSQPLSIVSGTTARLVQRGVTINSVTADRYAFDGTTLGAPQLGTVTRANGDVWVSAELGVIVKCEARYEGSNLGIGGAGEGILDMAFDLTDINKPLDIRSPDDTRPAVPADIPIPEDAAGLTAMAGVVEFKSARTPAEIAAFYDSQMALLGWLKTEGIGASLLTFAKGTRTVQIVIEPLESQTGVMIMTSE